MSIRFGTDGWRAVISEEFTFSNVRHVAQAIADVTLEDADGESPLFVVGYDTRFLSDRYAAAVAEVLAANGIRVQLCRQFAPTPAVSYAVVAADADGGVMLTASHNPPRYNGIKLKAAFGGGALPAQTRNVETRLQENLRDGREPLVLELEQARRRGLVEDLDPYPAYAAHVRRLVDFDAIARGGLKVAVDAMYGAGMGYTDRLLREAGLEPMILHHELNPGFGGLHPEPIERHLHRLIEEVREKGLDLGLATDGDADRIGAVGPSGRFIDPHCIMTLLLEYLLQQGHRGAVVKTVSTTQMLNLLADENDLPVFETPVGFNHISELMLQEDVLIGGEESGGISVKGHIPEGDGILMSLLVTELVSKQGGDVEALLRGIMDRIGHFAYARHDFRVRAFSKAELVASLIAAPPSELAGRQVNELNASDGVKYILADNSWLLIRPSGTEPVLRVYAEARDAQTVQELLSAGAKLVQSVLKVPV
ncbi:MAG: phosphoglucomutase/phosphomannomutase family protein [Caldilineae bacterium]|nr:MAG: phosphoglucomutase/phosphomannomutase family protein [Caldilineae bacterium]